MKHPVVLTILLAISIIFTSCSQNPTTTKAQTEALFRATREGNTDMVIITLLARR